MAFGRAFPIRAHTAGRLALPPQPPLNTRRARIFHAADISRRFELRSRLIKPHLPPPVISLRPPRPSQQTNQAVKRGERAFAERFLPYKVHIPLPVIARGPPVRPALVVSQANLRSAQRRYRDVPPKPYLAAAIVSQPTSFIAPAATIVSNHLLRRPRRSVPQSTILPPPVVSMAPTARWTNFVSLGAVERPRRLRLPQSTILPTGAFSQPPVPLGTFVSQATRRPYVGRTVPRSHLATPVSFFIAPAALIVSQAVKRASVRRSGHVVLPPAPAGAPVAAGTFVSQAVKRATLRRSGHVRLPLPPGRPPGPAGTFVLAKAPRPRLGHVRLAPAVLATVVVAPLPPKGTFVSQALWRPYVERQRFSALVAPPVLAQSPSGYATIIGRTRRTAGWMFIGHPIVPVPVPPSENLIPLAATYGTYLFQALERSYTRRGPHPRPHYGRPLTTVFVPPPPVPPGTFVNQAVERSWKRVDVRTQTTGPVLGSPPVLASLTVSNTVFHAPGPPRAYLRVQRPRLARPIVAPGTPVAFLAPAPMVVSQAMERAWGSRFRTTPRPHLAPRVAASAGPGSTIKLQAISRALLARSGRVHLPAAPGHGPVPPGAFVFQAQQRAQRGRGPNPKPHLAGALTSPFVSNPPLAPGKVYSVAVSRSTERKLRDVVSPAKLAGPVLAAPGPGATIKLQARARQLVRREGRVRLPGLGALRPAPLGTFVSQATRRPLTRRTVPKPHLAAPLISVPTFPPNAPGTFISQATKRASSLLSRRGHVRLAPPVVKPGRKPLILIISQALARPYVGRRVIPAHLASPVATAAGPGARLYYQAVQRTLRGRSVPLRPRVAGPLVSPIPAPLVAAPIVFLQATERAYLGRKVPPSPSTRYQPIVTPRPPPPPPPPLPPPPVVLTPGVTGSNRIKGLTNPRSSEGQTAPVPKTAKTHPSSRTGTTNPRASH